MSGFLAVLLGVFVVALVLSFTASPPATAEEIEAFQRQVTAAAQKGGQSVELGLKVGIGDLRAEHKTAPAVIAEQAALWERDLIDARAAFRQSDPPEALRPCRRHFVAALDRYTEAARLVREAALAPEADRDELLDRAVSEGRMGDRLYDRAAAALQQARRKAGLAPTFDFPDPDL